MTKLYPTMAKLRSIMGKLRSIMGKLRSELWENYVFLLWQLLTSCHNMYK